MLCVGTYAKAGGAGSGHGPSRCPGMARASHMEDKTLQELAGGSAARGAVAAGGSCSWGAGYTFHTQQDTARLQAEPVDVFHVMFGR